MPFDEVKFNLNLDEPTFSKLLSLLEGNARIEMSESALKYKPLFRFENIENLEHALLELFPNGIKCEDICVSNPSMNIEYIRDKSKSVVIIEVKPNHHVLFYNHFQPQKMEKDLVDMWHSTLMPKK